MNIFTRLFNNKPQLEFVEDNNGLHQLGGEIPQNFKIPENDFWAGMQYLGFINNKDEHFSWLPFTLHLLCPVFTDFDYLYLDYKNPESPIILYPSDTATITTAYDELNRESFVVYETLKVSLKPFAGINEDNEDRVIGISGKPYWEQHEYWPQCPETKKKMRFVAQLMSNDHVKSSHRNFGGHNDFYEEIFSAMNFWIDGDLKIFFEPSSKIACYFIQNT
ncbi:MAG: hypothetical protein QM731_28915 [Chitinophagaceae bacterium]